jgi:acyl-CoA thioesterase II
MSSLENVQAAVEASVMLVETAPGVWQGPNVALPGYQRLFGGQLLAQAVAAAVGGAVDSARAGDSAKIVRSLHLVFTAEGKPDTPVEWTVDVVHEGRTFASRSVTARQGPRVLATGVVSLHVPDVAAGAGGRMLEHSIAVPLVPAPAEAPAIHPLGAMAFETRPVPLRRPAAKAEPMCDAPTTPTVASDAEPIGDAAPAVPVVDPEAVAPALDGLVVGPPELAVWMRAPRAPRSGAGDTGQVAHQELLAYASDVTMMVAAMRPHNGVGFGSAAVTASAVTSHTISFHRAVRVDDWLLFVQESPAAAGGRAYIRGDVFDESGVVVASCAQEVLIRVVAGG